MRPLAERISPLVLVNSPNIQYICTNRVLARVVRPQLAGQYGSKISRGRTASELNLGCAQIKVFCWLILGELGMTRKTVLTGLNTVKTNVHNMTHYVSLWHIWLTMTHDYMTRDVGKSPKYPNIQQIRGTLGFLHNMRHLISMLCVLTYICPDVPCSYCTDFPENRYSTNVLAELTDIRIGDQDSRERAMWAFGGRQNSTL